MRCPIAKIFLMTLALVGPVSMAQAGDPTNEGPGGGIPVIPGPGGSDDPPGPATPDQPSGDNPAKNPGPMGGTPYTVNTNPPAVRSCALINPSMWIRIHLNGEKVWVQVSNPLAGC